MSNPFLTSTAKPGEGNIHLALLPPSTPRLKHATYQYPLKLISPAPIWTEEGDRHLVHTVYLLTYGGGLVAGDNINLSVTLEPSTRLVLLTQGSTKLFKSPSREVVSRQHMQVVLAPGSALCYLPDPVQPFEHSCYEQQQVYDIEVASAAKDMASLCVLDWVSNGRPANGENWSFFRYSSRTELRLHQGGAERRLLLRDNVALDDQDLHGTIASRMHGLGTFGTLILHGPKFEALGAFFMTEFKALPRIGGRKWDNSSDSGDEEDTAAVGRLIRQREAAANGVLWSAATVRGCVVIKFGAPEVEGVRRWLKTMLVEEGSVARHFGERSLLCLR